MIKEYDALSARAQEILSAAVLMLGGSERSGQKQMVDEICSTLKTQTHLMVQAGTGTGKSLGYLAAVLAYLDEHLDERAIVATATLALQSQLLRHDIPTVVAAAELVTGQKTSFALSKGRSNYACLYRAQAGGDETQAALVDALSLSDSISELGGQVLILRQWVDEELSGGGLGDRDDAPSHSQAAWSQVSVSGRECLGVAKCPFASDCFAERALERARYSQLVVTNHALLAIDAMQGQGILPEHQVLVIDEAHELVNRVTSAASIELHPGTLERLVGRCQPRLTDATYEDFADAVERFRVAVYSEPVGELAKQSVLLLAIGRLRDILRKVVGALGDPKDDLQLHLLAAEVAEQFDIASSLAVMSDSVVTWISARADGSSRALVQAPLDVADLMYEGVFENSSAVLTSATLKLGGEFTALAKSVGLADTSQSSVLRTVDVGSPFNYSEQGILYVARHIPRPGLGGVDAKVYEHLAELIEAAGGRTLGLFSSMRSAEQAAEYCRERLDFSILCQSEAQLSRLTADFLADPQACLFGTLSLWQGIDIPGDTCDLVVIDRIPFSRPDDPLVKARSRHADESGGNGFMDVSVAHAGLLLAQGSGRLIRTLEDHGVVAVLDSRLANARYGEYLRACMPGFWTTTDPQTVLDVLRRLDAAAKSDATSKTKEA